MNRPARDELERVLGDDRIATWRQDQTGGESDPFRNHSRRTLRRLTGSRHLRRGGLKHDVAADIIERHVSDVHNPDDAIDWYVRTALADIAEARVERNARTYRQRDQAAADYGFGTFWYQRLAISGLHEHARRTHPSRVAYAMRLPQDERST